MANPLFDALFATGRADALALEGQDVAWTYGDLADEAARLHAALMRLGVAPGDRVAVQVEKSPRALALYLACLRAGAVYLPLNPAYTDAELAYFVDDADPSLVVCDPLRERGVRALAPRAAVVSLDAGGGGELADRAAAASSPGPAVDRALEDLAAICYTSGTTGRSKGAMLTQRALLSNAQALKALWRFTADDRLIHALPTYHVHGLFVASHTALLAGASMIFQARFEPEAVLASLADATVLMGVPTFYSRLLAAPGLTREACAGMRLFVSGSAPLLAQTHAAFAARTGHAILERYGMTETGMNASNPYDGARRPGTVGLALPDVDLRIVDPANGDRVAPGEVGVIEVRGPNVCAGYWRNPDKTAEAFRPDGYFVTGDLGRLDADGYLVIVGRDKDLIITGGLNVYPKEVETEIDALEGVEESAVIGLPHADFGEAVTAVVVLKAEGALDADAILARLATRLARFKQPKRVLFAEDLPRNAMGKVEKARLRRDLAGLYG